MTDQQKIKDLQDKLQIAKDALIYYSSEQIWYDIGYKPWKHGIEYQMIHTPASAALILISLDKNE